MRAGERGFTLVAVLVMLVLASLALAAAGPIWSQDGRRSRELELLRIGNLYASALKNYYDAAPGSLAEYPQRLEQLTLDDRFVGVRRHLRRLYPDPVNGGKPWGLVLDSRDRIIGVYSLSNEKPIGGAPQSAPGLQRGAATYADWKFIAEGAK